jgi:hypothetical protein
VRGASLLSIRLPLHRAPPPPPLSPLQHSEGSPRFERISPALRASPVPLSPRMSPALTRALLSSPRGSSRRGSVVSDGGMSPRMSLVLGELDGLDMTGGRRPSGHSVVGATLPTLVPQQRQSALAIAASLHHTQPPPPPPPPPSLGGREQPGSPRSRW